MPSDLKIHGGEILWENEDWVLAEGAQCIVQNLIIRLSTEKGALFYAPDFGEGLLKFLHSPADEKTMLELEGALTQALRTQPHVVKSESVKVSAQGGVLKAELCFTVEGGEEVSLFLEWGDEFSYNLRGENHDI